MVAGQDATALQADLPKLPRALLIYSPNDQIVGAPNPAALPPDWQLLALPECGHMPQMESAARVNDQILTWTEPK
jgi:pimeloyl-ACP methyl ester carboxylesterase